VEHPPELHVADRALERIDVLGERGEHGIVALGAGELEHLAAVLEPGGQLVQRADDRFELLSFPAELLGAPGVAPDAGIFERAGDRP
jgi:hypothetical protein